MTKTTTQKPKLMSRFNLLVIVYNIHQYTCYTIYSSLVTITAEFLSA